MSSQLKEIVSHSDRSNVQNLFPESNELHFQSIAGRYERLFYLEAYSLGRRQSLRSIFPLGINGKASSVTKTAGIMYSGSFSFRNRRRSSIAREDSFSATT